MQEPPVHQQPHYEPPKPEGATTVFVFGLLGLLLCGLLGIVAWVQGNDYLARCRAQGVEPEGLGVAGRILGMIGTFLLIIPLLILALFVCTGLAAALAGT